MRSVKKPCYKDGDSPFFREKIRQKKVLFIAVGPADQIPLLDSGSHLFIKFFVLKQGPRKWLLTVSMDSKEGDNVHSIGRERIECR